MDSKLEVPGRSRPKLLHVAWVLLLFWIAWLAGVWWDGDVLAVARRLADPIVLARVESFAPQIRFAADESGLDPNLIAAMVYSESGGRQDAVSPVQALGLLQLLLPAASDAAERLGLENPTPEQLLANGPLNLRLGSSQFAWTLANEQNDLERALIAYNAGRAKLRRWTRKAGGYAAWREQQKRAGDSEVLAYAERVLSYAETFRERGKIDAP